MNSLSYLSVFISPILGLGVTHLPSGATSLIRSRHELKLWRPTPLSMATLHPLQTFGPR